MHIIMYSMLQQTWQNQMLANHTVLHSPPAGVRSFFSVRPLNCAPLQAWWSWSWRALWLHLNPPGRRPLRPLTLLQLSPRWSPKWLALFILAVGSQYVGRWYGERVHLFFFNPYFFFLSSKWYMHHYSAQSVSPLFINFIYRIDESVSANITNNVQCEQHKSRK